MFWVVAMEMLKIIMLVIFYFSLGFIMIYIVLYLYILIDRQIRNKSMRATIGAVFVFVTFWLMCSFFAWLINYG